MKLKQLKTHEAACRVQRFFDRNGAAVGVLPDSEHRLEFDDAIAQFEAAHIEQANAEGRARTETRLLKGYRRDLYDRFGSPIRAVAEHLLSDTPEYLALLLPSRPGRHDEYLARAVMLTEAAAKHEQLLIQHMLPADFVAQLRAATLQIATTTASRGRNLSRRSASTAAIKAGDKTLRDALSLFDAVLKPALRDDPGLSAEWASSRKIHHTVVNPLATGSIEAAPV
jgi:hypothetical protein